VSGYTISSRNNASTFNCSFLFSGKVNLVGALGENPKFLLVFKSAEKNKKKLRKIGIFYAKSVFDKIGFSFWCNIYQVVFIKFIKDVASLNS